MGEAAMGSVRELGRSSVLHGTRRRP